MSLYIRVGNEVFKAEKILKVVARSSYLYIWNPYIAH